VKGLFFEKAYCYAVREFEKQKNIVMRMIYSIQMGFSGFACLATPLRAEIKTKGHRVLDF